MKKVIVFLCVMIGCTEATVPDAKLVEAYSDVVIVREVNLDSSVIKQKNDSVLRSYGYDSTTFANELHSMSRTPQLLKMFFDSVSVSLSRKRLKLNRAQ